MPRKFKPHEDRELPPAGTHAAICCGVALTGWQESQFGVKEELLITWELPGLMMKDQQHFTQTAFLPCTLGGEKGTKLAKFIFAWFGFAEQQQAQVRASFEQDATKILKWLLGKVCYLSLVEKGDNINIEAVMAWPKGVPQTGNPRVAPWFLDVENPSDNVGTPPKWILDRAKKAKKPDAPHNGGGPPAEPLDFPFGANAPAAEAVPEPGVDFPISS